MQKKVSVAVISLFLLLVLLVCFCGTSKAETRVAYFEDFVNENYPGAGLETFDVTQDIWILYTPIINMSYCAIRVVNYGFEDENYIFDKFISTKIERPTKYDYKTKFRDDELYCIHNAAITFNEDGTCVIYKLDNEEFDMESDDGSEYKVMYSFMKSYEFCTEFYYGLGYLYEVNVLYRTTCITN